MVDDFDFRVTLFHDLTCSKAYFSQLSICALNEFFGFFAPLLFHFRDVGHKVRNQVNGDISANWLDYVQHSNLRPFGPELPGDSAHG